MPGISTKIGGYKVHIDFVGEYKPGDPPPEGYCDWHEWARVQSKAGLKPVVCSRCGKWKFPKEIARTETVDVVAYRRKRDTDGIKMKKKQPVCKECDKPRLTGEVTLGGGR